VARLELLTMEDRRRTVRRFSVALLGLLFVMAGCVGQSREPPPSEAAPTVSPTESRQVRVDRTVAIYSAVIRRLVTKDHTFGRAKSPFEHVYVVSGAVPKAGHVTREGEPGKPFSREVMEGIRAELRDLPPLDFVPERDSVLLGAGGVMNQGVVISLGPIPPGTERVTVENNLWCGYTCGQWLTYVLELQDGRWRVTGTQGPYAIS
jgi:hypothetical protein